MDKIHGCSPLSAKKKNYVMDISLMCQIQNFGRHVTCNMACQIDWNGTVLLYHAPMFLLFFTADPLLHAIRLQHVQ